MEPAPNPWVPVSPCAPDCIPPRSAPADHPGGRLRETVRGTGRLTAVATVLGVGVIAALVVPWLGPVVSARVQRRWALALVAATGLRLRLRGAPATTGGVLVVANHVSWLDVLALHAVAPVRLLAKREVRDWPLIGSMAARVGTVFLDRDRLHELPTAVATLARALAAGTPVGVFVEGTTRCGRALGPFRPAAFQAALDAGVPVQPVALSYRTQETDVVDHAAAFVGDDTLLSSLWRVVTAPTLVLDVTVLPLLAPATAPVPAGRAGPRRALAHRCAAAVAAELDLAPAAGVGTPVPGAPVDARRVLDRAA